MANVVLSTAKVYSDAVVNQPWLKSKFAILADNSKFQFPLFGESILVRNVTAGNISDYDKKTVSQIKLRCREVVLLGRKLKLLMTELM